MTPTFGCADVERFVDAYLDGEFVAADKNELERHIATCDSCSSNVRYQTEWRHAFRAAAPRSHAPDELKRRITTQLVRASRRRRRGQLLAIGLAVALALAVLAGFAARSSG